MTGNLGTHATGPKISDSPTASTKAGLKVRVFPGIHIMTEKSVLQLLKLPKDVFHEVLAFLGSGNSLPFALTSKSSLALIKEEFDFREEGIETYKSCFLQSDEMCEYGRDVMEMDMTDEIINIAARLGLLNAVKWLRAQPTPCRWSSYTCKAAAEGGQLAVLNWLRSQDPPCEWNEETPFKARMGAQLEVLQWLRDQYPHCPGVDDYYGCR